ncbi:MAG TPA: UPF0231 family protein [Candidatus Tenderia electrophaga]|uniref:UPF0231 family protein n=1 Tax=Candidatus Tenderia electrophaga TaxID=1748243 RepID=A0A832J396_9GAMM|nr:UPF0231 family protein [Candidatus Tenderia electrophaga]
MDYEFRRNLYGRYQAVFSMGHEALGLWLTEELATDQQMIVALLSKIEQLQARQRWQYQQPGREFILTMNQDGVEVRAALLDDMTDEAPDELNHYDQESYACCGLDDFRQLLQSWAAFIKTSATG